MIDSIGQDLDLTPPAAPTFLQTTTRDENFADQKCEKFVAFFLGDCLFAIPAEKVIEIARGQKITSLPYSSPNLLGITPVRGDIVAVGDLRRLVSGETISATVPGTKLIVFRADTAEVLLSVEADRMHEMITIAIAPEEDQAGSSVLRRVVDFRGSQLHILDPDLIGRAIGDVG